MWIYPLYLLWIICYTSEESALTQEVKCITFIFQTIMHSSVTHLVQGVSWYGGKQFSVCWGHCEFSIYILIIFHIIWRMQHIYYYVYKYHSIVLPDNTICKSNISVTYMQCWLIKKKLFSGIQKYMQHRPPDSIHNYLPHSALWLKWRQKRPKLVTEEHHPSDPIQTLYGEKLHKCYICVLAIGPFYTQCQPSTSRLHFH